MNNIITKKSTLILLLLSTSIFMIVLFISTKVINKYDNNSYVLRDIVGEYLPVVNEVNVYSMPYAKTNVNVLVNYYDLNDSEEEQQRSLILFENTYMPNTGILYSSEEEFEITSMFNGKVTKVTKSDELNNIVEITYNNNILARYSSLKETYVDVGDEILSGDVIGISGNNEITTESQNMLLVELIINGETVDPENYYNQQIEVLP